MAGPGRKPDVTDEDILAVLRSANDPVQTTSEVADKIDLKHRGTYERLSRLADEGRVRSKKVGAKATVWWVPDD